MTHSMNGLGLATRFLTCIRLSVGSSTYLIPEPPGTGPQVGGRGGDAPKVRPDIAMNNAFFSRFCCEWYISEDDMFA